MATLKSVTRLSTADCLGLRVGSQHVGFQHVLRCDRVSDWNMSTLVSLHKCDTSLLLSIIHCAAIVTPLHTKFNM